MPTSEVTFAFGSGQALLDPAVRAVRHRDWGGLDYLAAGLAPQRVLVAGTSLRWWAAHSEADLDELEVHYRPVGREEFELVLRHAFRTVWVQRYTVINHSPDPVRLDDVSVGLRAGPSCLGSVLAAGAEACWLSQPEDGRGPVLAATLQFGQVRGYADGCWRTGPIELAPGGRYVLQWQLDWQPSPAAFAQHRPSRLPARIELELGQPCEIADADQALLVDPQVRVSEEGETSLLMPDRPGRFGVELRSARGTVSFDLTWYRPLTEWVRDWTQRWLEGRRTSAGVARLPGSAAGIVVQQALADRIPDSTGAAADALDRVAAQALSRSEPSVFDIALLAGESLRSGDPDCAGAGLAALLARSAPAPGLGLAATRLGLAELAAGRRIGPLITRLTELAAAHPAGDPSSAAALELALITRAQDAELSHGLLDQLLRLGAAVGAGQPGRPMRPVPAAELGYAAGVLALVPEGQAASLSARWSLSPHALADQLRRRALAELTVADQLGRLGEGAAPTQDEQAHEPAHTLAWLILSRPTG